MYLVINYDLVVALFIYWMSNAMNALTVNPVCDHLKPVTMLLPFPCMTQCLK